MDKIIEEFLSITKQLDDCAIEFKILKDRANQLKANFNKSNSQIIELRKLEKDFEKLNKVTFNLRQKASKLKDKKPK